MLCLVKQPNGMVLEVEVEAKAKGQQCLDKVCQMLGIIEVDYFGLQYIGNHGEKLWVNMRNQIRRQLSKSTPYRLQLRVKFFVPPHQLLQDITRHHVYLSLKQDVLEENMTTDIETSIRFSGLIAQAELGDISLNSAKPADYLKWMPPSLLQTVEEKELSEKILSEHAKLSGTKQSTAEYLLLKQASELPDFGLEQYTVKSMECDLLLLGVGPQGITVRDKNCVIKHRIPYGTIHVATQTNRCFFLTYIEDNGESQSLGFKLESGQAANAIYRAVTEKHAFYSCETVRNAVTSQFIRNLKGTIVSLFNENTALGKNYVFDIRRTCREVYDYTRRTMYQMESTKGQDAIVDSEEISCKSKSCQSSKCKEMQSRLAVLQDSILCRICMDEDINTVFSPCRHVVCCNNCAPLCDCCPLCRASIQETQFVYLPLIGTKTVVTQEFLETENS